MTNVNASPLEFPSFLKDEAYKMMSAEDLGSGGKRLRAAHVMYYARTDQKKTYGEEEVAMRAHVMVCA